MTRISPAETQLEGASAVRAWRWIGDWYQDAAGVRSTAVLPRHTRSWAGMFVSALVFSTLVPGLAQAAPRDVTVSWNPSPSAGVVSYVLSVGTSSRGYSSHIALTSPSVSGDVWSDTVSLEDSVDQYLALRAVNDSGQYSVYSNEIVIPGAGGDPDPVEPDFGVTSLQGLQSVVSGVVFVEAIADAATESVEFRLDDVLFRVENAAPYAFNSDDGPGALIGWDTNTVPNGFHTISATGYSQDDAGGELGRAVSVTFEVSNGPEPLGAPGKPMLVVD